MKGRRKGVGRRSDETFEHEQGRGGGYDAMMHVTKNSAYTVEHFEVYIYVCFFRVQHKQPQPEKLIYREYCTAKGLFDVRSFRRVYTYILRID